MNKSKTYKQEDDKNPDAANSDNELFKKTPLQENEDEIESDGSASAFDATENIDEDNFDNLSEK